MAVSDRVAALGFPLIIITTAFTLVVRTPNGLKEGGSDFAHLLEVLPFLRREGVPDIGDHLDEISHCFGPAGDSEPILFPLLDINTPSRLAKTLGGLPCSGRWGFPLDMLSVLQMAQRRAWPLDLRSMFFAPMGAARDSLSQDPDSQGCSDT
jgi:hypothetical protein